MLLLSCVCLVHAGDDLGSGEPGDGPSGGPSDGLGDSGQGRRAGMGGGLGALGGGEGAMCLSGECYYVVVLR